MAGFHFGENPHGGHEMVFRAPLGATQTYDNADPVQIATNLLVECDRDGAVVLDSEFIGFAFGSALGQTAGSRATATSGGSFDTATALGGPFGDVGATANVERTFVIPNRQTVMWTENYFADSTGAAQTTISDADLYDSRQICSAVAGDWGLSATAATAADHVSAMIVRIVDGLGNPFNANTAATTAGPGTGVRIYFIINNIELLDQISGS